MGFLWEIYLKLDDRERMESEETWRDIVGGKHKQKARAAICMSEKASLKAKNITGKSILIFKKKEPINKVGKGFLQV